MGEGRAGRGQHDMTATSVNLTSHFFTLDGRYIIDRRPAVFLAL